MSGDFARKYGRWAVIAGASEGVGASLADQLAERDAGVESPRETSLRLLLIGAGFPRPQTQIPVWSADGSRQYFLDMGWKELMLAVEYDGDHHRVDRARWAYEIQRSGDVDAVGWDARIR